MQHVFLPILLACVSEARAPEPHELVDVAERIRREAFPHDPLPLGWERAWCVARVALGAVSGPDDCEPGLTAEMFVTYPISLTTGAGTMLEAEVHASATAALARVRELDAAGVEATIMGPNGEKLSKDTLGSLAIGEGYDAF